MHLLTGPAPSSPSLNRAPDDLATYGMSRSQLGLWLAYKMSPDHSMYNLAMKLELDRSEYRLETALQGNTWHDADVRHAEPYVAEWAPNVAVAHLQIQILHVTSPVHFSNRLRAPVPLSDEFAVRWFVVLGPEMMSIYVVAHHIALDGTSMSILSDEMLRFMANYLAGEDQLPHHSQKLRADTANDQAAYAAAEPAARDFWLSQVRDTAPVRWINNGSGHVSCSPDGNLNPAATPQDGRSIMSDAARDYRAIETWTLFSKADLRQWSARYNTSWFRVMLAAIGVLVRSKCAPPGCEDTADFVLTTAFAGRPAGLGHALGHFVNALPVRVPFTAVLGPDGAGTFDMLVKHISEYVSAAKRHEVFSLLDLQDAARAEGMQIPRSQVAVTLSPRLARNECELLPVEGAHDLFFCFLEGPDAVELGVIYNPTIFSESTITSFKSDFASLCTLVPESGPLSLRTMAPGLVRHLRTLPPALDLHNEDQISETPWHQLLTYQAAQNPDAVALFSAESQTAMTYAELDRRSSGIASYLQREFAIQQESLIQLHLTRGFSVLVWILAVLKSGGAFCVSDLNHPRQRTKQIVEVARPLLVVVDGEDSEWLLEDLPVESSSARLIHVREVEHHLSSATTPARARQVTKGSDLAYVIFTSGSSGKPKGVEITHSNLTHFVTGSHSSASPFLPGLGPGARMLQWANFTFDASLIEWAPCLAFGGTLCFAAHPKALVGEYLLDVVVRNAVTHVNLTASVLASVPADVERGIGRLRVVSVGGEMVPDGLVEVWRKRGVVVQNAYGPTECAMVMSHHTYPRISKSETAPVPACVIGHAHDKMSFYVCSEDKFHAAALANGEVGEICIAGPQVGRGYRNRPDLTADRFCVHPLIGARLYRTGDRGKMLPDGSVMLLGRVDREVKIRGFRINFADVERHVASAASLSTAVSAQSHPRHGLCVFLAPEMPDTDVQVLKRVLKERVPGYMVPSAVFSVPVSQFPLNVNGKTDHKRVGEMMDALIGNSPALGVRVSDIAPSQVVLEAKRDEIQQAVHDIWMHHLPSPGSSNENRLSDDADFFDIGGNSLILSQIHASLRTRFPTAAGKLSLIDLFQHKTIEQQAQLIRNITNHPQSMSKAPGAAQSISRPKLLGNEITVIGMAGRFPGAASPAALHEMMMNRTEAISTFHSRVNHTMNDSEIYVPRRGMLLEHGPRRKGVAEFGQGLLTKVAAEALMDAGINLDRYDADRVGLYVGVSGIGDNKHDAPSISTRTAYDLNLQGPNVTLDAACSGGMVALSLAVDHLRLGRCDASLIRIARIKNASADRRASSTGYLTAPNKILSPSGHCRPFDDRSDGTVPGEAVCALVLCREQQQTPGGDSKGTVYGVISGISAASDGSEGKLGPTGPCTLGQIRVVKQAWRDCGLDPAKLAYAEMHGSGTRIGDALELEALVKARSQLGVASSRFTFGSNKGNVGNCEAASGLISVIKLLQSFQPANRCIPPLQSFERLNPSIDLPLLAEAVVAQRETAIPEAPDGVICSVTSLGYGGINVHCILRSVTEIVPQKSHLSPSELPIMQSVLSLTSLSLLSLLGVLVVRWILGDKGNLSRLPGPPSQSWLFGHLPQLYLTFNYGENEFKWLKEYGTVYLLRGVLGQKRVMVADPVAINHMFRGDDVHFSPMFMAIDTAIYGDDNVSASRGEQLRAALNPGFTTAVVKSYLAVFETVAQGVTLSLDKALTERKNAPVNVSPLLSEATLAAISQVVLGLSLEDLGPDFVRINSQVIALASGLGRVNFLTDALSAVFPRLPRYLMRLPTQSFRAVHQGRTLAEQVGKKMIGARLDAGILEQKEDDHLFGKILTENAKRSLRPELLAAQTSVLLVAGQDTTANTLTFALYELAQRPEVQSRLRAEVLDAVQDTEIRYDAIPVLNAVIKEALRLYPAEALMDRIAAHDMTIPLSAPVQLSNGETVQQLVVSKGQWITVSSASYQRSEGRWGPEPEMFDPNRWIDGKVAANGEPMISSAYANLLTFNAGPHTCLGWRFAVLEMQVILTELISKFVFEVPEDPAMSMRTMFATTIMPADAEGKKRAMLCVSRL
ncbi:unnamed protein product [Mycena citricolor]|uniref:Non-ribosomal peptide synthetase n=1 Tax=Mycena citricolor TaxID=2018698 RepID=A0AAD2K734_9AGAR|nr:unnamed protein product [Mycena citricolor]